MEPFLKLNARSKGSRRGGGGNWLWPMLALGAAGVLIWIWWQSAQTHTTVVAKPSDLIPTPKSLPIKVEPRPETFPKPTSAPPTTIIPSNVPSPNPTVPRILSATDAPLKPMDKPVVRSAQTVLEAQIALASLGISTGPVDGSMGSQSRAGIRAFQAREHLPVDGDLNEATLQRLYLTQSTYSQYVVSQSDVARLSLPSNGWLEKSERESLDYESILELVAERFAASQGLIKGLNPGVFWTNVTVGTLLKVPNTIRAVPHEKAASVHIHLASKTLEAFGAKSNLLAHFPCSIARKVEKRPVGRLTVAKLAANPNYVFDPDIYPESEEAKTIGRKLVIPPGPNNPVGTAWIGLDKPGYGIHGTPRPEQVGRTESHGCFRLANWNAEYLIQLVWVGMPVYVDP